MENEIQNFRTKATLIATAWETAAEPQSAKKLFKGEGVFSVNAHKQVVNNKTTWVLTVFKFGVACEAVSAGEDLLHAEMVEMAVSAVSQLVSKR